MTLARALGATMALGASLLLACGATTPAQGDPSAENTLIRPVKIFEVGQGGMSRMREWPARIEPAQNAELSFEVEGKIMELPIDDGQALEKGELIAKLNTADYRAKLDSGLANLKNAKQEHTRSQELLVQGAVAQSEVDANERAVGVAQAAVRAARKAVDDCTIKAPFAGTVANVLVEKHQQVRAKQTIATLQDISALEVVTQLPERDIAGAKKGLSIEERNAEMAPKVVLDSFPGRKFDATLKMFETSANPDTQTYKVTWKIDAPSDVTVLPGMTAKVLLTLSGGGTEDRLLVPATAVTGDAQSRAFVWRVDPESMAVSKVLVSVGEMSGDQIVVLSGLNSGDLVSISGVQELSEGTVVRRYTKTFGPGETNG